LKLLKVQWKDGDVITERHFRHLEHWSETYNAVLATQSAGYGLLKVVESDGTFNSPSNISIKHLQGTQYQVSIENILGITSKGRLISIFDQQQFDLTPRTTERERGGFYPLFLVPTDEERKGLKGTEVMDGGPLLYEPFCRAQTFDDSHDGLCITRFKADGPSVSIDLDFLPLCYTINASPQSIERFDRVVQSLLRLITSIEQYVSALVNRKGLEPIWVFCVELVRLLYRNKAIFSNSTQTSRDYFLAAQTLFDSLVGELRILAADYKEPKLLGEIHDGIGRLSEPLLSVSLDWNMAKSFDVVEAGIDTIAHILSRFPEGPAVEASLPVKDVTFAKGTAYNKLLVQFLEEVAYSREETKLLVKLRDYSTREPTTWDVRLSLGADMPYGSLPQLNNLLKRVGTEEYDFRIEFPGELLGAGSMRQMTLYLPPPLGEAVDSHRNRVTISIIS
jgi:hypothetical protein